LLHEREYPVVYLGIRIWERERKENLPLNLLGVKRDIEYEIERERRIL